MLALFTTLILATSALAAPLEKKEDDYFQVNYYSDGSCQNYIGK